MKINGIPNFGLLYPKAYKAKVDSAYFNLTYVVSKRVCVPLTLTRVLEKKAGGTKVQLVRSTFLRQLSSLCRCNTKG